MSRLDELRGLPAHRLVQLAGLPMSLAQVVMLKSIEGAALDRPERSMFRKLTRTGMFAKPREGGYREAYLRLGRRSGKSTRICSPLAVAALLAPVDHLLAPGESARVLLVAPNRDQTRTLVDTSSGLLDLLGVQHEKLQGAVRVPGLRTTIETATADAVAPRGPTAVLVIVDEASLLPYEPNAEGSDRELVAALRPTLATTKGRFVMVSTPWGMRGVHYERVEAYLGTADTRGIAFAGATWICNPSITEQQTHDDEPDERVWKREWLGVPGEVDSAAFNVDDLDCCIDVGITYRDPVPGVMYSVGYDEGGRQSARTCVVTHRELNDRPGGPAEFTLEDLVRRWAPGTSKHEDVMAELAAIKRQYNDAVVTRDLFAGDAVASIMRGLGIRNQEVSMSPQAQAARFRDLQSLIESHRIRLLDNAEQRTELMGLRETLHQGGRVSYGKGGGKGEFDDIVDALALSVQAAQGLATGGGDILWEEPRIINGAELRVVNGYFYRLTPSGDRQRVAAPPGTAQFQIEQQDRLARGVSNNADLAMFGEHELARRLGLRR